MRKYFPFMPLLFVVAAVTAQATDRTVAGFSVPPLSPMPIKVAGVRDVMISLNGQWDFSISGDEKRNTITVPGEWEMQGYNVGEGETAIYSKALAIPGDWKLNKIKIRFDGVSSHALIKVNGIEVGEHEGGFAPFEVDITNALKKGENLLQVEVRASTISDRLACTSQYASHTVGGILRKVTLFVLPEINIAGLAFSTSFDKRYEDAVLHINCRVANEKNISKNIRLAIDLKNPNGKTVLQKTIPFSHDNKANTTNEINTFLHIAKPAQWNNEHPNLYSIATSLMADNKIVETNKQRIGFREIKIQGNQLLINGVPVKLHGVNRHSSHALTGRSLSAELDRKDAQLFRDGNCNFIRTSHYPPSEELLEAADELGLFIESEASLCWIEHHASPIWQKWNYLDTVFLPYMVTANIENILAGKNHPSIIIWSLGNESLWSPLWAKVNDLVKELDPFRPTTFHDQCWGNDNNAGSTADIAVYHYPTMQGVANADTMARPVYFGEYAHVPCYNRRELATDPGLRANYAAELYAMYDSIYYHKGCLGGAIWSGVDDIFHMPDGRIIGMGPWGVIDSWRRPKPEYFGMKKAYATVVVIHASNPVVENNILKLEIENRYDFTNLKNIGINYTVNGIRQQLNADIQPHHKKTIAIPVGANANDFYISFIDPRGFVVNEEKIRFLKSEAAIVKTSLSLSETNAAFVVRQGDIIYQISKQTGIIVSAKKDGKIILTRGPAFGIVPVNEDDGGKPNIAGENYQNAIYPIKNYPLITLFASNMKCFRKDDGIKMEMDIAYSNGKGKQSYFFTPNGTVKTECEVKYNGNDSLARQYGLMMSLPQTFNKLEWETADKNGMDDANDTGRRKGLSYLNAKKLFSVEEWGKEPANNWKDDANEFGSNDFRSTKRLINKVAVTDELNNTQVEIISDGKQYSRAWLQDEQIQLLIASYSNGGAEPYWATLRTEGFLNAKNTVLKSSMVFRIN